MGTIFSRTLNESMVKNLLNEKLWNEKLKPDCLAGNVFMALRDNYISFYYKGGNLFTYKNNRFETHIKYAALLDGVKGDYVTEKHLENAQPIRLFPDGYDSIKKNCLLHVKEEDDGISHLYHNFSYFSNANIVLLDIQVSFSDDDGQDRIDFLLLNKSENKLRFIEAKLSKNKEIVADLDSDRNPKVITQIIRYQERIKNERAAILTAYKEYVKTINLIFGTTISAPNDIDECVGLLIFKYDQNDKTQRLEPHIIENAKYDTIRKYLIGDITGINIDKLWQETTGV